MILRLYVKNIVIYLIALGLILSTLTACSLIQEKPVEFRTLTGAKNLFREDQSMRAFGTLRWTYQEKIVMEDGAFFHSNFWLGNPATGRVDPIMLDGKQVQGCKPVISPNGQYLAYIMFDRDSCSGGVQILSFAPSLASKQLLDHVTTAALAWSLDSSHLALMDEEKDHYDFYFYTMKTGEIQWIYTFPREGRVSDFWADNMAWSPDGNYLAFSLRFSMSKGQSDMYVFSIAEKSLLKVAGDPELSEIYPSWSPEGVLMYVVYNSTSPGLHGRLAFYNMQKGCNRITTIAEEIDSPQWSPDGKEIAFIAYNDKNEGGVYSLPATSLGIDVTNPDAICSPSPTPTK
jgi:Tol biopolymer transport system component